MSVPSQSPMSFRLVPCDAAGSPVEPLEELAPMVAENCRLAVPFYESVGYAPPWVGYVAVADGVAVGGGGFKGPPAADAVEIAYYTLPQLEGRGFATRTARQLVAIARAADPRLRVTAQTLPEENASTAVLQKLGFERVGTAEDPDVGTVWEWQAPPGPA